MVWAKSGKTLCGPKVVWAKSRRAKSRRAKSGMGQKWSGPKVDGPKVEHLTHHIFSSFARTYFIVTSTLGQVWRAARTFHSIPSSCAHDVVVLTPFHFLHFHSHRLLHSPGRLLLPRCGGQIPCTLANEDLGTFAEFNPLPHEGSCCVMNTVRKHSNEGMGDESSTSENLAWSNIDNVT